MVVVVRFFASLDMTDEMGCRRPRTEVLRPMSGDGLMVWFSK